MLKDTLYREEGSVLIVVLIFLVLLTFMGIAATSTTNIELQIAHNEEIAKDNFYSAEAAAMECLQRLDNLGPAILTAPDMYQWLEKAEYLPDSKNILNPNNWIKAETPSSKEKYIAVDRGVEKDGSLGLGKKRVYVYRVVGKGGDTSSNAVVEIGFKKAL